MKDFVIENGVLEKYRGSDTYVTIPDNVTYIGEYAFFYCTSLKQITIPNSVTKIDDEAFSYCTSLQQVTIPDSVTYIGYYAFRGCSSLKEITIPNSVTGIGVRAFNDCTSLKEIAIPDNATKIGDFVFSGCTSLKEITIPDSVTEICNGAFRGCNLKTLKFCYKAFSLNENNQLQCKDYIFDENKEPIFIDNTKICELGYHYCENLFEIFNYYSGELDVDIVIYEIEPCGKILKEKKSSKCCCQSFKFKRRLYREDIIRILNGGE